MFHRKGTSLCQMVTFCVCCVMLEQRPLKKKQKTNADQLLIKAWMWDQQPRATAL